MLEKSRKDIIRKALVLKDYGGISVCERCEKGAVWYRPKNESPASDHLMSSSVLDAFTNLGE